MFMLGGKEAKKKINPTVSKTLKKSNLKLKF